MTFLPYCSTISDFNSEGTYKLEFWQHLWQVGSMVQIWAHRLHLDVESFQTTKRSSTGKVI